MSGRPKKTPREKDLTSRYFSGKLTEDLGIAENVEWLPWQDREGMASLYADHHVLLFPAMHDSGGMVVLEAMNHGLPVVCLKLGGPATLVRTRRMGASTFSNRPFGCPNARVTWASVCRRSAVVTRSVNSG